MQTSITLRVFHTNDLSYIFFIFLLVSVKVTVSGSDYKIIYSRGQNL